MGVDGAVEGPQLVEAAAVDPHSFGGEEFESRHWR